MENNMTDIEKLLKAQDLLSDLYTKYGELFKDNYAICSPLSCADSCIIDVIEILNKIKKDIG